MYFTGEEEGFVPMGHSSNGSFRAVVKGADDYYTGRASISFLDYPNTVKHFLPLIASYNALTSNLLGQSRWAYNAQLCCAFLSERKSSWGNFYKTLNDADCQQHG